MYGIGLQRQGFDVLSHLGVLISYTSLVRGQETTVAWRKNASTKKESSGELDSTGEAPPVIGARRLIRAGPLKTLSAGCRQQVKDLLKARVPCGLIFDNINLVFKVAQQGLGHIGMHDPPDFKT